MLWQSPKNVGCPNLSSHSRISMHLGPKKLLICTAPAPVASVCQPLPRYATNLDTRGVHNMSECCRGSTLINLMALETENPCDVVQGRLRVSALQVL